jgi:uncharacterized caspase-like protein
MSMIVQATCPGCKKVLRIPADWLRQAFRCKYCRTVIQARANGIPAPSAPPPSHAVKKAPPSRPSKTPLPVAKIAAPAVTVAHPPVALPAAPVAPMAIPVPTARPAVPVAMPAPAYHAGTAFDPFSGIDESAPSSHRRRGGRGWAGFIVGLVVLGIAGGTVFALWPQIAPLFDKQTDDKKEAKADPHKDKPASTDKKNPPRELDPTKDGKKSPVTDPDPTKRPPDKKPPEKKPPEKKPPEKTPPESKPPDKKPPDKKPPDKKPPAVAGAFPRRALIISVHNYLYANPISFGDFGAGRRNFHTFLGRLPQLKGFRISPQQIVHLSDAAPKDPHPPVKSVIENTLTRFLKEARAQDRILVLFAGHGVEIDGEAYLVPIEGELGVASTLIPLKWVYKQLSECKARQKLFIVDVCRLNPVRGVERPAGSPMSPKFDLALKNPPKGVQVWTACSEGQQSYEFEDARINNGLFMDALYEAADRGVEGVIQKPNDPFPVKQMVESINKKLKDELEPLKKTQTTRLSGSELEGGAAFNPEEEAAPRPTVAALEEGKGRADDRLVRSVLKELNVPPVKKSQTEGLIRYEALPPFQAKTLEAYPVDNTPTPLRDAIERAQVALWAISPNAPPQELAGAVAKFKQTEKLKTDLNGLRESFRAPGGAGNAEKRFKDLVEADGRRVASMLRVLEEELDNMTKAKEMRAKASKRWQANYDFMLARLEEQIAYVYEYSSMLGQIRKEFPPRDPAVHGGWRLASREQLQGDATGRKLHRDAQKILAKLAADNAGTPWEVLAKREKLTALGLKWEPEK